MIYAYKMKLNNSFSVVFSHYLVISAHAINKIASRIKELSIEETKNNNKTRLSNFVKDHKRSLVRRYNAEFQGHLIKLNSILFLHNFYSVSLLFTLSMFKRSYSVIKIIMEIKIYRTQN